MSFEYSPYILPLLAVALVTVTVGVYAWIRRSANGALALCMLAVSLFAWALGYSLEVAGADLDTKYFWGVFQYIGIAFAPYFWLVFSITYDRDVKTPLRRIMVLLALVPSITVLLAFTTKWHGLIWSEYRIEQQADFSAINVMEYGLWFWAHFGYSYLLLSIGAFLLLRALWRRQGMYRGQVAAMLVAVLAPWVGNALYLTGNSPIPYLDLTPFAFTVTVVAVAWAIFGYHLVDIAPLARDLVVDSMREGMIVLDARGNVVDINSAAARMIGIPASSAIGKTAEEVFHPWLHLVEKFSRLSEVKDEISVGEGEAKRSYEARLSPLQGPNGLAGRVIMLRAMDEDAPQPRFANDVPAQTEPQPVSQVAAEDTRRPAGENPLLTALRDFYDPPIKSDLAVPIGFNPVWYRTRERIFTLVARLTGTAMGVGILFYVFSGFPFVGGFALAALMTLLLVVGNIRDSSYYFRVVVLFVVVYSLAVAATLNFGFSAPGIAFFMFYVVASAVLSSPKGAFYALGTGLLTVSIFAFLIGSGTFVPLRISTIGNIFPFSILSGLGVIFLFATVSFILLTSNVLLLDNLDRAWRKETQTLNLLQQERDLLEQRVEERTRDLAAARDEAEKISSDLRKYFRAIEQSGSTIVITDTHGSIEYANPRFEQTTGYSIAEALGGTPRILKSGRQPDWYYRQMWETISAGKTWNGEFMNRRKDGSLYWEYATIAPVIDQNGVVTNYVAIKEDITERKRVEDQLLKLSQAVEQSGNTVIVMDRNGLVEYVNPKFTEVTGYAPSEAIGKSPAVLMNGTDSDFREAEWWLTVSAGEIWHGEFCNHRKDGSMFWESATIAPVHDRDGGVINFVEIKQDITEQKILQERLQQQNDYLSILHQITLDLLNRRDLNDLLQVIVDRSALLLDAPFSELMLEEGGFLVVKAFTERKLALKGERVPREQASLSWSAFDMRQPVILDDYSTWEHRLEAYDVPPLHASADFPVMVGERCIGVLSLGRFQSNYTFTPEQVENGILFARLAALVLDNASLYDSAVKEIAERKYTEALLQESQARFRQIVENASDIIYRTDAEGNFTYVNPSAMKMMGYTSEGEVLGRNYLEMTTPEFHERLRRIYLHQSLSKTQSTYYEFPAVTADGVIVWVGQNVQLIMDGEKVAGFQAVARDITQLKQAQEALALSRDQALDASRFKSQLLSRVSHELRTPLGGILGYAELLQYKAFGNLNENQQNAVDNIIESTHYLTSVVNDLLDEAQIESKSLSLFNEYFNPAEMLDKIATTMTVLAKKKGLEFTAEIEPDLPDELYGDVNRLRQIVVNLAGNAVKFTKEGGVSLRFSRPAPAEWSIEVRDTGAGIPVEEQENIFEPFRQVNNSITRGNRGSGLGLAITKQLVELMGGQISLESGVGKGSHFTVTLPIVNAPGE